MVTAGSKGEDVRAILDLVEHNLCLAATAGANVRGSRGMLWGVTCLALAVGSVFAALGVMDERGGWPVTLLGLLLVAFSLFLLERLLGMLGGVVHRIAEGCFYGPDLGTVRHRPPQPPTAL
jgi:hypothetical protein